MGKEGKLTVYLLKSFPFAEIAENQEKSHIFVYVFLNQHLLQRLRIIAFDVIMKHTNRSFWRYYHGPSGRAKQI